MRQRTKERRENDRSDLETEYLAMKTFIALIMVVIMRNNVANGVKVHDVRDARHDSLGFQVDDVDPLARVLLPDVTVDLRGLLAAQLTIRTLKPGLMAALISEVAVAIALEGEAMQALGTVIEGLLGSARRMLGGHLAGPGTYEAHQGVHHEKI